MYAGAFRSHVRAANRTFPRQPIESNGPERNGAFVRHMGRVHYGFTRYKVCLYGGGGRGEPPSAGSRGGSRRQMAAPPPCKGDHGDFPIARAQNGSL
ncbi:hypothetical protein NL676_001759 [Syzygium grande]|nr:hypothetical protein NL676_001759 [Syzygium grande]